MLLRNNSGATAAEYALILALVAAPIGLAALALGSNVHSALEIKATGVNGRVYTCTSGCQYEYVDYCAAAYHKDDPTTTWSPALPSTAACDDQGRPIS